MKKIVIRVITYNQEELIRRALNSVLCQKEWGLYRIIVSDDCSKDHTWDILKEYRNKYPDIMEIHQNEYNLGIYGNVRKADEYLKDYDLYGSLSGDDAYCDGYFEAVQKFISKNNINTDEPIGIYSDWKAVTPNGKEILHRQNVVLSGNSLWSLKARGFISTRSLLVSKMVKNKFDPILEGRGLCLTESHYDSQSHLNIKKAFYIPQTTTVYYTGLGVSVSLADLKNSNYYTTQALEMWNYCIEHFVCNSCDLNYVKYEIEKCYYFKKPSLNSFIKMLVYSYKGKLPGCNYPTISGILYFVRLAIWGIKNKIKKE